MLHNWLRGDLECSYCVRVWCLALLDGIAATVLQRDVLDEAWWVMCKSRKPVAGTKAISALLIQCRVIRRSTTGQNSLQRSGGSDGEAQCVARARGVLVCASEFMPWYVWALHA